MKNFSKKSPAFATQNGMHIPFATGFFAVMLSCPALAGIAIPDSPLQSNTIVPPNIMFILDDSGSMGNTFMPPPEAASDAAPTTNAPNIGQQTYARNGVYYNPAKTYEPWKNFDGTGVYTADTPYTAVYSSTTLASGGTTNLSANVQTYYVPKNLADKTLAYLNEPINYWRYQILTDGRVIRSERINYVASPAIPFSLGTTGAITSNNFTNDYNFVVPAGVTSITFNSSGGTGTSANLYVLYNASPNLTTYTCRSQNAGNTETCTIANPTAGTWRVRVYANGSLFSNVSLTGNYSQGPTSVDGCDTSTTGLGWRNCTQATPTGRSETAEKQNFATWYSFHRTRTKVAKAGAGAAFSELSSDYRVGFTTIWNRNTYLIPVGVDNGLFRNETTPVATNNRSVWFDRLYAADASGNTPLLPALQRQGNYFSDSAATGPYGPESGTDQLACRQNFSILTTDGFWNSTTGYTALGNSDNTTAATTIPVPSGSTITPIKYTAVNPYSDGYSNTLADVANYYWKTDLRTLNNIVPPTANDPAYWQHMVTYGISIGLKGRLDPDTDIPNLTAGTTNSNGTIGWPDPTDVEDPDRIDDLFHASVNGHGKFIAAQDPDQFSDGLRAALAGIAEGQASNSNVTANSTSLDAGSFVLKALYVSGKWTGDLFAYSVDASTGAISATSLWQASQQIPLPASRNILTWNGTAGATFPTAAQNTTLTTAVVNYLKGVRTGEVQNGGALRNRVHVLGDIVNSSPVYVKDTNTVYVSANDGMMHSFDGTTGAEKFAYVPGGVNMTNLKMLSDPDYVHRYYVDGALVVSSRTQTTGVSNFTSPNNAKNILVGALGRGGKGVFSLDVTNPNAMTGTNVKWESAADADMGYVLGRPFIAKLNNGVSAVIVPNGYNSTNDRAALFIYDLNTGGLIAKVDTGVGTTALPNGLSSPIGWDEDNDGDLDYVYSGDLQGNMWKFDLSSSTPSNWTLSTNRTILYTAFDGGLPAKRQPITGRPTVARDPSTYKRWVFFGTGRFLSLADPNSVDVQTWYGVQDEGVTVAGRSALQQRNISVVGTLSGRTVRGFDPAATLAASKKGWYVDLVLPPNPPGTVEGERMVGDQRLFDNILFAPSIIPSATACDVGGRGYLNAIDAFTGTSVGPAFFDVDGDGIFDDTIGSGAGAVPVGSIDLGVGMITNPFFQVSGSGTSIPVCGSAGTCANARGRRSDRIGRISWRELLRN
jgi:type IV pilus assembly protein PilY1